MGWHVTGQRQVTALTPSGQFQDAMAVTYQTDAGVTGEVRIPLATYSADTVKAAIDARVTQHDAVGDLSG